MTYLEQSEHNNGIDRRDSKTLEHMIDHYGIETILVEISDICAAKAEHIACNWQDTGLAKRWARLAGKLDVFSTDAEGL